MSDQTRIDKWLWAVRIFKSRNLASEFCKSGKVLINEQAVKPSRSVNIGDIIQVRKPPVTYSYKVLGIIGKRVSAKIAVEHVENITPTEEIDRLKNIQKSAFIKRDRGAGLPTKKERRDIDKLRE